MEANVISVGPRVLMTVEPNEQICVERCVGETNINILKLQTSWGMSSHISYNGLL